MSNYNFIGTNVDIISVEINANATATIVNIMTHIFSTRSLVQEKNKNIITRRRARFFFY